MTSGSSFRPDVGRALDRIHRACGRSSLATRLALKVRNQCDRVVAASVSDGIDMRFNGELWLVERLRGTVRTFVDVGANVGDWTEAMLRRHERAVGFCFEPSPSALAVLSPRALSWPTVRVVPKAVSDEEGVMDFCDLGDAAQTSGAADVLGDSGGKGAVIEVPVVTLDRELERLGVLDVDLLKIDAEGLDWRVLRGTAGLLSRGRVRVVQFEYGDGWARSGGTLWSIVALLSRCGYGVRLLRSSGLTPVNLEALGEFFAYSNFVAFRKGEERALGVEP